MKKHWDESQDLRTNLRKRLPKLARKYIEQGGDALLTERTWEEIHQFRLATKRFRYTLEVFEPFYGPGLQLRVEDLKNVQKMLGEANDLVVTAGLLESIPETESVRTELLVKAERKTKKLRSWWRSRFASPAAQKKWWQYLASVRIPFNSAASEPIKEVGGSRHQEEVRDSDDGAPYANGPTE